MLRPLPRDRLMRASPTRGFTIIELMVVVTILALFATVAFPSYREYVKRSHRSDARAALMKVAQFMERASTANGRYPLDSQVPSGVLPVEGGTYSVSLVSTDGATFVATATRNAGSDQANDRCGDFRINHTGQRTILNASGGLTAEDCWRR